MADVKISALPAAGSLTGTEVVPLVQSGTTARTTAQAIANLSAGGANTALSNLTLTSINLPLLPYANIGASAWIGATDLAFAGIVVTGIHKSNGNKLYDLVDNRIQSSSSQFTIDPDGMRLVSSNGAVTNLRWGATLSAAGNVLAGVATPLAATDAANKAYVDGASSGANTALSNLASVAIATNISPGSGSNDGLNIGTDTLRWGDVHANAVYFHNGTSTRTILIAPAQGSPSGVTADAMKTSTTVGGKLGFWTDNSAVNNATQTGDLIIETGNKTSGTGNSGSVVITPGTSAGGTVGALQIANDLARFVVPKTVTTGGTTGDQTINKISGTVNIAATGTSVTVTCAQCSTSSIVFAVIRTNDTSAVIKNVVPGSGSFVIRTTAAVTAETSIGFLVMN